MFDIRICSYCSGRNPWKNESNSEQSFSDGKLEVVGFRTKDFMLLQIGGHGDKIAQASNVKIVTKKSMPMQVDGEPVLLKAAEINIAFKNEVLMIQAGQNDTSTACTC